MVCRIDVTEAFGTSTIHIAGRLAGPTIGDLLRVCNSASGKLRIDLTDLLSVDTEGISTLRRLAEDGAELCGVAQYLHDELGQKQPTP